MKVRIASRKMSTASVRATLLGLGIVAIVVPLRCWLASRRQVLLMPLRSGSSWWSCPSLKGYCRTRDLDGESWPEGYGTDLYALNFFYAIGANLSGVRLHGVENQLTG